MKSTPVWRMALPQVSPSMPTQAEAACEPEEPEGSFGVGTVKVAVTDLYVPYQPSVSYVIRYDHRSAYLGRIVDGTSPVGGVLNVGGVGLPGQRLADAALAHSDTAVETLLGAREGQGRGGSESLDEEGGDEHG